MVRMLGDVLLRLIYAFAELKNRIHRRYLVELGTKPWIVDGTASEGKFANSDGTGSAGARGRKSVSNRSSPALPATGRMPPCGERPVDEPGLARIDQQTYVGGTPDSIRSRPRVHGS